MNRLTFCLLRAFLLGQLIVTNSCGSPKTTSCLWFGSLLASDNKQLVFRKNVFQCLYTLCSLVHELSDFQKLVPCLQRKPFRHLSTSCKRVGQSYLKNLWQNASRVKKIYILILLQFTKYWRKQASGKTNSSFWENLFHSWLQLAMSEFRKLSLSKQG